jgi:hypothetical protein
MRYFRLQPDPRPQGRWVLGNVLWTDNWRFISPEGQDLEPAHYTIELKRKGKPADFNFAGYAAVPVVSGKFRAALNGLPETATPYHDTVFLGAHISGETLLDDFFIFVTEGLVDCVDESRSKFEKFTENDPVRPDLAGHYKSIFELVVAPEKLAKRNIARIQGARDVLIVSEHAKKSLDKAGLAGLMYTDVSPNPIV